MATDRAEVRVGLIVNPASGHDVRRLVSGASLATNNDKVGVVRRLLAGLGSTGVDRVLVMPDASGLSLGIERAVEHHRPDRDGAWPAVEFVAIEISHTVADTGHAVSAMMRAGVRAIVVVGGDGTARAVASVIDDTPLVALSTGTNNAFGVNLDATAVGLAVGLVASGRCVATRCCQRAKRLDVRVADRCEIALVDLAVVDDVGVGSRAVWHPTRLKELVVTIAEPGAIGLSAIAAAVSPCGRGEASGRHLTIGPTGRSVLVAIAPGLVRPVGVVAVERLAPGEPVTLRSRSGVLAFDGEREVVLDGEPPVVTLSATGPLVIDVPSVLRLAAEHGWFDSGH